MARKLIAFLLCLLLAACDLPLSPAAPTAPRAWFDMPLDQSVHPPGPLQMIFHASDPGGIAQVELWVNGQPAGTFNSPDTQGSLLTFNQNWTPPGPGKYTLQVRALSNQQAWSDFTQTTIVITGEREAPPAGATPTATQRPPARSTPTIAPSPTPSPLPRLTSTLSPLPSFTPTPAPLPGGVSLERVSTDLVYLGRGDCGPLEVTISVRASAPGGIRVVVLFYRFQDGSSSREFQSVGMDPRGGDLYMATLNPTSLLGGSIPFEQAALQYQAVIQQNDGDTSLRTPVMSDIRVQACGRVTAACSAYTDERSCIANGCSWVNIPGTVPLFECRNP